MAYSETLAKRIREKLSHLTDVQEKRMFGSLAFMVNGKMCVCAGKDTLLCRVGTKMQQEALTHKGVHAMEMKGRTANGFVTVDETVLTTQKEFDYWIDLALTFNKKLISEIT